LQSTCTGQLHDPDPPDEGYAALVADGRLLPGYSRPLDDVLADLDGAAPAGAGLSAALAQLRDEDR
jgi:hypothetical protein